jgi:hypothetical protein
MVAGDAPLSNSVVGVLLDAKYCDRILWPKKSG